MSATEIRSLNGYKLVDETARQKIEENSIKIDTSLSIEGMAAEAKAVGTAHNNIYLLIENLTARLNTLADSDDTTLDQLSEIVTYIKSNKTLIENITTNKINVSDIIDNLTTEDVTKPLSANQGVVLKTLIDNLPAWAKAVNKPSYTASEIGTGTFTGAVMAKSSSQTPSTSLLRNSKIVSTETNPSNNGEICWMYE